MGPRIVEIRLIRGPHRHRFRLLDDASIAEEGKTMSEASGLPTHRAHRRIKSNAWEPERGAEVINDHILMSRGLVNCYLVASDDGDVVVGTGTVEQAPRHRERFEQVLGRSLRVLKIVLNQSHTSHIGGWPVFAGQGVETLAQRNFWDNRLELTLLAEFGSRRGSRTFGDDLISNCDVDRQDVLHPEVSALFDDSHAFSVGGRRFELYSTPGGETTDSLVVWLPEEGTVLSGNLFGELYGELPHLATLRRHRSGNSRLFIRSAHRVIGLRPNLLLTAHGDPIGPAQRIRADLTRITEAVQYIHDRTVEGMNRGEDLWTLMSRIKLPPDLEPAAQGRGLVSWYVRAVWEESAGSYLFQSTTELYSVPPQAVWSDLAQLAGGPDIIAERAAALVAAGKPVEATYLNDIALFVCPDHKGALRGQIAALEVLLRRSHGDAWDEVRWLETELVRVKALLHG